MTTVRKGLPALPAFPHTRGNLYNERRRAKQRQHHHGDGRPVHPEPEWRLINAWSIALCGAIITLVPLCTTGPQVYRDAIIFLPDGLLLTFKVTAYSICGAVPLWAC